MAKWIRRPTGFGTTEYRLETTTAVAEVYPTGSRLETDRWAFAVRTQGGLLLGRGSTGALDTAKQAAEELAR